MAKHNPSPKQPALSESLFADAFVRRPERLGGVPAGALPAVTDRTVVNVSKVPQRSPLRYPGGKTWLVPHIRLWLRSLDPQPRELVEPFAGGAIVGLTAAFEGLATHVTLVELDENVGALWQTILNGDAQKFADDVVRFDLSLDTVRSVLAAPNNTQYQRAFATLLKNRVQRGGILAPGASLMKLGENGRGIASRWYPQTLRRRILAIASLRDRITFVQGDGIEFLKNSAARPDVAYFLDPPYTKAGRRLYAYSVIDHARLFEVAASLVGDFLMTYDDAPEIRLLAEKHGFDTEVIAMQNTHLAKKTELLIGRNLDWARLSRPVIPRLALHPAQGHTLFRA